MEKQYEIGGLPIQVEMEEGLVRIANDPSLRRAVGDQPEATTSALMSLIKADHEAAYGKALAITDDSFAVEIWGHLCLDYFLLKYKVILKVVLRFGLYDRLCRSCEVIDCGERGKDPNRRIWDALAPLRKRMARRVPRRIRPESRPM